MGIYSVNDLLKNTLAGKIALKLDAQDGNGDKQISISLWNDFVKKFGGKVREITSENQTIGAETVLGEITKMAIAQGKKEGKSVNDMAKIMLNDLGVDFKGKSSLATSASATKTAPTEITATTSANKATNVRAQNAPVSNTEPPKGLVEFELGVLNRLTDATEIENDISFVGVPAEAYFPDKGFADFKNMQPILLNPPSFKPQKLVGYGLDRSAYTLGNGRAKTEEYGDYLIFYNKDGYIERVEFKNDPRPHLSIERNSDNNIKKYTIYEYDKNGKEIKRVTRNKDGEVEEWRSTMYLSDGCERVERRDSNNKVTSIAIYGWDFGLHQEDIYKNGKISKSIVYDKNGITGEKEFDEKGKLKSWKEFHAANKDISIEKDDKGRIVSLRDCSTPESFYVSVGRGNDGSIGETFIIKTNDRGGFDKLYDAGTGYFKLESTAIKADEVISDDSYKMFRGEDHSGNPVIIKSMTPNGLLDPDDENYLAYEAVFDCTTHEFKYFQKCPKGVPEQDENGDFIVYDREGKPFTIENPDKNNNSEDAIPE